MDQVLRKFIFIVVFCWTSICALSQPIDLDRLRKWQIKGYAESAELQNDLYTAIIFNEYLYQKKNQTIYLKKLASLNFDDRNYNKSALLYKKLDSILNGKMPNVKFKLAMCYKSQGKYNEALDILTRLNKNKRSLPNDYKQRIINEIEGCNSVLMNKDTLWYYDIKHLNKSINTKHSQVSPVFVSDSVFVYGSTNVDSVLYYSSYNAKPKRKFYQAFYADSIWSGSYFCEKPYVNSDNFDTGSGCFSLNKKRFYFTQSECNWQGKLITHLFVSKLVNGEWTDGVKLNSDINYKDYSTLEPCIGICFDPNLEVIYFTSNREGGYGGTDIWYTIYNIDSDSYEKVLNSGIFINTSGNEASPYYDVSTHTMYFSSDAWGGVGGLDIYSTEGDLMNWTKPVNLGFPINSSSDDLNFSVALDGTKGLFTSNRPQDNSLSHATGCDDIYIWKQDSITKVWISGNLVGEDYMFEGVSEIGMEQTELEDVGMNLYLEKDTFDLVFLNKVITDKKGNFSFSVLKGQKYQLRIDDIRALNKVIAFDTDGIGAKEMNYVIKPKPIKIISQQPIKLQNIYYEFNKANLIPESREILDSTLLKLLYEYTELVIEVIAHTDNIGSSKFNMNLSKKRANNVKKYLISKGIDASRIKAVGYGESMPMVSNTYKDGRDNPEGREENRRTEFKIISEEQLNER